MNDVIIVTGPTASGKSRLAHILAKSLNGEILVADSIKIYRGADIGSAKPPPEYSAEIKYHLLDICDPDNRYDVGSFYRDSCRIIEELHKSDRVPVVCGGTSFYIARLLDGLADIPAVPDDIRCRLEARSTEDLYEELKKSDPERALELHPNMRKRIVRALGVGIHTGKKMSVLMESTEPPPYNFIVIGINWERSRLYERINKRVDKMLGAGLVEEARDLYEKYSEDAPVLEGVGYRQLIPYFKSKVKLEDAVLDIKQATRNYAKSQLIWWKNRDIIWVDGTKLSFLNR